MEWSACGLLISTHFSAFNGGAELTEVWGEAPRGLATGAEEEEKEFQHLGRRRSSEVATEV